jgi:hypothetical protein
LVKTLSNASVFVILSGLAVLTASCVAGDDGDASFETHLVTIGTPSLAPRFTAAFQANTGSLWIVGPNGRDDTGLGMAAGTSPSYTFQTNGRYVVAVQANTGELWTVDQFNATPMGLGMAAGTSPSISRQSTGSQIAFQATTGTLWETGRAGTFDTGLTMAPGTSPNICELSTGGNQVAFQGANGTLWTTGAKGTFDTGLAMAPGASPAIGTLGAKIGGFQIAFQADNGRLWVTDVVGRFGTSDTGIDMENGTSPDIIDLLGNGNDRLYLGVVHTASGAVQEFGSALNGNPGNIGVSMSPGTSPSIGRNGNGNSFNVMVVALNQNLFQSGAAPATDLGLAAAPGTSPSI